MCVGIKIKMLIEKNSKSKIDLLIIGIQFKLNSIQT